MRKKIEYLITIDESRDKNKLFSIEEAPAFKMESWCYKALTAIFESGTFVMPNDIMNFSSEVIAMLGISSILKIKNDKLNELFEEIFEYIKIIPEGNKNLARKIILDSEDIQEVSTLFELRLEWLKLNLNFLKAAGLYMMKKYLPESSGEKN